MRLLVTGSDTQFQTDGCTSEVLESGAVFVEDDTGLETGAPGTPGLRLGVPAGAVGSDASFQIMRINSDDALEVVGLPSGLLLSGDHTYELRAYEDVGSSITSFGQPISITIEYEDADLGGLSESSLVIYHYTGGNWSALTGCTVNTAVNTVTCSTSSFSLFALVGSASSSGGSSGSSTRHAVGTNIVDSSGTIYTLTADGKRRPYTSAGAFLSYGFNSFSNTVKALAGDLKLPVGSFIPPRDGSITCSDRGTDKGTCYLITDGKKAGFTSATVFTSLGFSFLNAQYGDVSFMESAPNISTAKQAHHIGTLINNEGTLQIIASQALVGIPSMSVLTSWGYNPAHAVLANSYDKLLEQTQVLSERLAGILDF